MSRKKRKRANESHLPGAKWQDVKYGDGIVTRDDLDRSNSRNLQKLTFRCRDCKLVCRLAKSGGTIRCANCGGILDPVIRRKLRRD